MHLQRYRKGVPPTLTIKYLGLHSTFLTHTAAIITSIFKFQPCTPASSNTTEILDFNSNRPSTWRKQETQHIPQISMTMPVPKIASSTLPHLILHSSVLQQFFMNCYEMWHSSHQSKSCMHSFDIHQTYSLTQKLKKYYLPRCYLGGLAPTWGLLFQKEMFARYTERCTHASGTKLFVK